MNNKYFLLLIPILICAAGCATDTRVTLREEVGPDPALTPQNSGTGFLQVYSARERVPIDLNREEFFWNDDYGRNEFLFYAAHTSYALYAPGGRLLERVRNANGMNDADPTMVKLSPGVYNVEAEARDYDDVNWTVMVPVLIKPGLTTTVHLDGNWNPAISRKKGGEMVWLPNESIVGWHSAKSDDSIFPSRANTGSTKS
ncbi:MAG: hypothetical protein ACLP2Y_09065 [Limisphaerales bacterium]